MLGLAVTLRRRRAVGSLDRLDYGFVHLRARMVWRAVLISLLHLSPPTFPGLISGLRLLLTL